MTIQIISTIGVLIIGLSGIISTVWINRKLIVQKNREDEKKEIYKKLNEFYGPLILLRKKSQILYEIYSTNKRDNRTTLEVLLANELVEVNDKILLGEIVSIGQLCEDLILNKSGLVDDKYLRLELLPKAISHFYILREAFNHRIIQDFGRFGKYSFPFELDSCLENGIEELKRRLDYLNSIK